jgi:uncharacterized membrane protein
MDFPDIFVALVAKGIVVIIAIGIWYRVREAAGRRAAGATSRTAAE